MLCVVNKLEYKRTEMIWLIQITQFSQIYKLESKMTRDEGEGGMESSYRQNFGLGQ